VQAVDEAERLGAAYPPQPPLPAEPRSDPRKPCGYYDGTLAPLLPVPIKGVVWCHGDHNVQRAAQHRRLFAALIHGWREAWNNPQLPVVFTQSAGPGGEAVKEPAADSWADLRASQEAAKALPTTAMVPTLDIGMSAKTVPEIARRLARAALTAAYGRPMDGDGAGGAGEDAR